MPHIISFDAITGKPAPQGDLSLGVRGPLSLVQNDGQTFYKGPGDQLLGPLGGEGVFSAQNIDEKGSVIVGDNHFTGAGGDSLTGNETSQLPDQPTDDYVKLGDIKGFTSDQNSGAGYCTGHSFETFEPIAGMDSFGESVNPAFDIGVTSGPGGMTYMTGQFDMPTDNLSGTAGPGGSSF